MFHQLTFVLGKCANPISAETAAESQDAKQASTNVVIAVAKNRAAHDSVTRHVSLSQLTHTLLLNHFEITSIFCVFIERVRLRAMDAKQHFLHKSDAMSCDAARVRTEATGVAVRGNEIIV